MLNIYFKHYISIKNNYIILISIKVKSPLNELMLFHYVFYIEILFKIIYVIYMLFNLK